MVSVTGRNSLTCAKSSTPPASSGRRKSAIRTFIGFNSSLQCERDQRVVSTRTDLDNNELLAGTCAVGHRHGRALLREAAAPSLFARLLVECAPLLVSSAHEHKARLG